MIAFALPPLTLEIADGDISEETTDVIVNAANNHFWMGGGVAGALKARGGVDIEREAMARGPVEPGACIKTTAGRLRARAVIHGAVMGQDLLTSADLIRRTTINALALAADSGFESIAFPAFGTGVGGFPVDRCARIMIEAIREHAEGPPALRQAQGIPISSRDEGGLRDPTPLRLVRLVLFGRSPYDTFVQVARDLIPAQ